VQKLYLTWDYIRGLFQQAWAAVHWYDGPSGAWEKIKGIFGPPIKRLVDFAIAGGKKLLEFIFEGALALAGGAGQRVLAIFRKIGDTFSLIVADPVRFLGNLLSAVKGGFNKFVTNIVDHLKRALFEWLTGALGGAIQLPSKWDLRGIISVVLQVLGLTYARMREKLVKLIGEPAVKAIEVAFEFIKAIVTGGLAAAWQKLLEFAKGLVDTVISGIRDWVITSIVKAAVTKLVTMFNPVGAIIQGIITIYNTVMFFIERAQQIAALVESIVDSIANIATGNIGGAIDYVEATLGRALTVIISFLARLIGLGGVADTVKGIIKKIQGVVSDAIDKVVAWVINGAKGILAKVAGRDGKTAPAAAETTKPEAASGIKKDALVDLRTGIGKAPIDSAASLKQFLADVHGRFAARGLKGLAASAPESGSGPITISATASVADKITLQWTDVFHGKQPWSKAKMKALRDAFKAAGRGTTAAVSVDGKVIGAVTSGTLHAEGELLGNPKIWNVALDTATKAAKAKGSSQLVLIISRSPCHAICTTRLANVEPRRYPGVSFVVAPTGTYRPVYSREMMEKQVEDLFVATGRDDGIRIDALSDEAINQLVGRLVGDVWTEREDDATTVEDLARLMSKGWQVSQLQARHGHQLARGADLAVKIAEARELNAQAKVGSQ
jgi:hypothetical protein